MKKLLSFAVLLLALALPASAGAVDYNLACVEGAQIKACTDGAKLKAGKTIALANLPAMDIGHIVAALAAGGNPINATVIAASTRVETPTIGTSSIAQHALPSGTAALLASDSSLPAANLTGDVARARISTALAAGGDPVAGTVVTAATRVDTPTIGTSSGAQHALPAGTADILTADSTATVTGKSIDAGQLTGNVLRARITTALAAGGDPVTGTVLTATTRTETPTIGTSSGTQHALPSGTATLVASDDPRLPVLTGLTLWATPVVGEVGYISANSTLAKAQADASGTTNAVGVYQGTAGAVQVAGGTTCFVDSGLTLAAGNTLYLSATTAGRFTNVEPSGAGQFSAPLGYLVSTSGYNSGAGSAQPCVFRPQIVAGPLPL